MGERPQQRPRGRPVGSGKPPEEKFRGLFVRLPPGLLAEFNRRVPEGERSEFVRRAIASRLGVPYHEDQGS